MTSILFVEDDDLIRENVTELLRGEGFAVDAHADSTAVISELDGSMPDMAILDITLGDETEAGFQLCAELRKHSQVLPIIFFTSHDSDFDRISGMRLGVDDYLTKDISLEYLVVRIRALLRRVAVLSGAETRNAKDITCSDLVVNLDTLTARWKGEKINLSLTQLWMLYALINHPGQVKSHDQLMQAANIVVEPNTIAAHIKNIREKFQAIDPEFSAIKSERGFGYRWVIE